MNPGVTQSYPQGLCFLAPSVTAVTSRSERIPQALQTRGFSSKVTLSDDAEVVRRDDDGVPCAQPRHVSRYPRYAKQPSPLTYPT
jgi:hypothetical protein